MLLIELLIELLGCRRLRKEAGFGRRGVFRAATGPAHHEAGRKEREGLGHRVPVHQAQQPPGLVSSRYTQAKAPQEPTHSRYRTGQSTLLYISNRSIGSHSASAGATTLYADLYTALSAIA